MVTEISELSSIDKHSLFNIEKNKYLSILRYELIFFILCL